MTPLQRLLQKYHGSLLLCQSIDLAWIILSATFSLRPTLPGRCILEYFVLHLCIGAYLAHPSPVKADTCQTVVICQLLPQTSDSFVLYFLLCPVGVFYHPRVSLLMVPGLWQEIGDHRAWPECASLSPTQPWLASVAAVPTVWSLPYQLISHVSLWTLFPSCVPSAYGV